MNRQPARSVRTLALLAALVLTASACTRTGVPEGFERRATPTYEVLVPEVWQTVEETSRSFQAVDPEGAAPMTVRVVVAPDPVEDVSVEADRLREAIPFLADDAELVSEQDRQVPGATGAVELVSHATLAVTATGDERRIRLVDLLARRSDGQIVVVKVQGPADDFDDDLATTILSSLVLLSDDDARSDPGVRVGQAVSWSPVDPSGPANRR